MREKENKMKKILTLVALVAIATGAQADTLTWGSSLGGGDGTTFATNNNWWSADDAGLSTHAPTAADFVAIDDDLFTNPLATMPTVSAGGQQITQLILGAESAGQLGVVGSGSLTVTGGAYISHLGTGTLNLSDTSYFLAGNLIFGNTGVSGVVNMTGSSILHAGVLTYLNGDVTSTINMTDSAWLIINGDQSGMGYENSRILASGAGESIAVVYNATDLRTEYTVIPEPATLSLVALLGGGMLWIRKRFMI